MVWSVGDLPYKLVRPILLKVQAPEQLHAIEQASPHLIGETDELWLNFIKRDVPNWETKRHMPSDPKNWLKVWKKLRKEAQEEMNQGKGDLVAALSSIKKEREKNQSTIVSTRQLPKPKQDWRSTANHNYATGKTGSKGAHKMSALQKIIKDSSRSKSHPLNNRVPLKPTRLTAAPMQFVEEIRRKNEAAQRQASPPKAATARSVGAPMHAPQIVSPPKLDDLEEYDIMKDREARLRALKNKPTAPPKLEEAGCLTAADLEDSDGEGEKDRLKPSREILRAVSPSRGASPMQRAGSPMVRGASPMRTNSPKPMLKRKEPPSLFHTPKKRPVPRSGVS